MEIEELEKRVNEYSYLLKSNHELITFVFGDTDKLDGIVDNVAEWVLDNYDEEMGVLDQMLVELEFDLEDSGYNRQSIEAMQLFNLNK